MWPKALFLPLSLGLAACAAAPTPPQTAQRDTATPPSAPLPAAPLADAHGIAIGQRAYADGPIIEVVDILEDSRCPQNARCVWAGRLKLQMIWHRGNGEAHPFEITLGEITDIADGHIEITAATPPRLIGEKSPAAQDYRFSFRFRGGL